MSNYFDKLSKTFGSVKLGPILNKLFGPAYIKNLITSTERRDFIIKECQSIDLEYKIVEAVNGLEHCDKNFAFQHGPYWIEYPSSAGFIGVNLTAQKIISYAITEKLESLILLDDDCIFSHTNKMNSNFFTNLETNLPVDWDVIILGSIWAGHNFTETPITYHKCTQHSQAAGSHGLVFNKSIFKEYKQHLVDQKIWGDGIIGHFIDIGKNVYIIIPSICQQNRQLYSDINKCYHNG